MPERPYQRLIAWKEAHKLCVSIYTITKIFPSDERFRLTNQMCRSASSVPTNIAEGNAKRSAKEKAYFFEIALCSLEELHYQSFLSRELHYLSAEQFAEIEDMIQRTSFLITKLRLSFTR